MIPRWYRAPFAMVSAFDIVQAVSDVTGFTVEQLKSHSRKSDLIRARHVAYWLVRKHRPKMSLPAIACLMGNRDHSTVLHGIRKVDHIKDRCDLTDSYIKAVRKRLKLIGDQWERNGELAIVFPAKDGSASYQQHSMNGKIPA